MLTLLAAVAQADCARPNVFSEAERADRVAVVEVGAKGAARVVEDRKGDGAAAFVFPGIAPPDGFVPQAGHRYLLFLEPDDRVELCARTLDLAIPADRALADAVEGWLATPDVPGRTALLVRAGAGADEDLADEALAWLGARPDLLAAITPVQRASLVGQVPAATGARSAGLAWTLARIGAVETLPAWIAWLGAPHTANSRPVVEALQLLTNHRAAGYVTGRDVYGEDLARVRADLAAWWQTWGTRPAAEAVEAGFASRPADDPLSAAVRRNRCELGASLSRSALPAPGASGEPDPACP